jgi:hypothetical protein
MHPTTITAPTTRTSASPTTPSRALAGRCHRSRPLPQGSDAHDQVARSLLPRNQCHRMPRLDFGDEHADIDLLVQQSMMPALAHEWLIIRRCTPLVAWQQKAERGFPRSAQFTSD